ncbi:MAG: hypothetical protein ACRD21_24690 [Vicinamibacteria bacterium]
MSRKCPSEWTLDRCRVTELQAISRASGGVERTELASVWEDRAFLRAGDLDLRPALLWCFLFVFLLEALSSRVGWRVPEISLERLAPAPEVPMVAAVQPKLVGEDSLPASVKRRRTRFARARDGR